MENPVLLPSEGCNIEDHKRQYIDEPSERLISTPQSSSATLSPQPSWTDNLATNEDLGLFFQEQNKLLAAMVDRCASTREVDSLTSRISVLESDVSSVSSRLKELENMSSRGSTGGSTMEVTKWNNELELTIPRAERPKEGKRT